MKRSIWNSWGVDAFVAPFWCAIVGHVWFAGGVQPFTERVCLRCTLRQVWHGKGWIHA
jgi:hypothetical protein